MAGDVTHAHEEVRNSAKIWSESLKRRG